MERAVFALSRFQSLEYPDIARTLGISTAAVECQLVGALRKKKPRPRSHQSRATRTRGCTKGN
jgi:DNA-directed RNA polymerase specialized sigma24 family protein